MWSGHSCNFVYHMPLVPLSGRLAIGVLCRYVSLCASHIVSIDNKDYKQSSVSARLSWVCRVVNGRFITLSDLVLFVMVLLVLRMYPHTGLRTGRVRLKSFAVRSAR